MENKDFKSIRHAKFYKNKVLNNSWYNVLRKKWNLFFNKFLFFSLFVFVVKFLQPHFISYWWENYTYFIPEINEEKNFLSNDWFILQKSIQTQKRKKTESNEIIEYEVKSWDTLSKISTDYQLKLSTILWANPSINPYKDLKIWSKIKILPVDWVLLYLKKDESLEEIAKNYKTDKNRIISQNDLKEDSLILKKWINIILPWAKPVIISQKNSYWTTAPKYVENIKSYEKSNYLIWPTKWVITQYFHKSHYAIDVANASKWPIFAATNWKVIKAKSYWWNGGYWKMIKIDDWKWIVTLYAHNEKIYVKEWDVVKQWDTIWWMWKTWRVRWRTWIHLHFEVIVNWVKRNPLAYIK
jgi:murein DD-endopeptidase MepM/ murein hydrolase activator NlpD